MNQSRERICFGDFQTPRLLADEVCAYLRVRGVVPQSIVEPTCGIGSFLLAAAEAFPGASRLLGAEINREHLAATSSAVRARPDADRFGLLQANFFDTDWPGVFAELAEPILVAGNPPWVTSATQGLHDSDNLPAKSNFHRRRGIDAITGAANFDVSEWMLSRLFDGLTGRHGFLAMLCKTAVARRVLKYAWQRQFALRSIELHTIDARGAFGAAVQACLLVAEFVPGESCDLATVFPPGDSIGHGNGAGRIGWRDGRLVADLDAFARRRNLCRDDVRPGEDRVQRLWRSGVKHDCADVMELVRNNGRLSNKLGEFVDLEPDHLFPLIKSGDIAAGRTIAPRHWLLLPQRFVGDDTAQLERTAPRTWRYLLEHATRLDARRSSIYRRQPRFAVFGVGAYTFAPWKVVVSGLAKRLRFLAVGPVDGRPVVLDDTSYFLPCETELEATAWTDLLNSRAAIEFLSAFIFWDAKRPVTAELLRKLDLERLASDAHLSQGVDRGGWG